MTLTWTVAMRTLSRRLLLVFSRLCSTGTDRCRIATSLLRLGHGFVSENGHHLSIIEPRNVGENRHHSGSEAMPCFCYSVTSGLLARMSSVVCQSRGRSRVTSAARSRRSPVEVRPRSATASWNATNLQPLPNWENSSGCCGPTGDEGLNRACPCGAPVATLAADCFGPHELHLDPVRTYAFSQ